MRKINKILPTKIESEVKNEEIAISIIKELPEVGNFLAISSKYGEKTKIIAENSGVEDTYIVHVFTDLADHLNTFNIYKIRITDDKII